MITSTLENVLPPVRRAAVRIWRALRVQQEQTWRFTFAVGLVFAALQVALHIRHEVWRDEIHTWIVARNAGGLWDLLTGDRRYDGHPILWYYVLYLISRLTRDPIGLHLATLAASIGAAVLWLRHAPLPRWLRLLLLLSYDFAYEYGVMCRSYALGVLLAFAFCAVYRRCRVRYFSLAVILSLLAATSVYGTILAVVLGIFLFSRGVVVAPHPSTPDRWALSLSLSWLGGVVLLVATLVAVAFMSMPPADAVYGPGSNWRVTLSLAEARQFTERYWWAMFPMRASTDGGWIIASYLGQRQAWFQPVLPALVAVMFVAAVFGLRRSPRVAFVVVSGTLLMALCQQVIYAGWLRHWDHYLILLLVAAWLLGRETRLRAPQRVVHALLACVLVVQAVTGVRAFYLDWQLPFSSGLEAARFIARTGRRSLPIIGDTDHPSSTVAGYLDRQFVYAQTGDMDGTVVFHNQRHDVPPGELVQQARMLASRSDGVALIVVNHDLGATTADGAAVTLLHHTAPSLIPDEEFFIYEVRITAQRSG